MRHDALQTPEAPLLRLPHVSTPQLASLFHLIWMLSRAASNSCLLAANSDDIRSPIKAHGWNNFPPSFPPTLVFSFLPAVPSVSHQSCIQRVCLAAVVPRSNDAWLLTD